MASTTASSSLPGAWFGELASAVQGTWQAAAASRGDHHRPRQPPPAAQKLGARGDDDKKAVPGAAVAQDKEGDVVRYGGAMSDTTLYLLLDRFSPS